VKGQAMRKFKRCWIIGAGAVGSVIAACLQMAEKVDTHLVGESEHAKKIQTHGLHLEIIGKASQTVQVSSVTPPQVPVLNKEDLVLLTGKIHGLEQTTSWLREKCGSETGVIALQNGIGPEAIIEKSLKRAVDRGLVFFGAHSNAIGNCRYFPGGIRLKRSEVTEGFCALLDDTAIQGEISSDFNKISWQKAAINCIANPFTGILRTNNREVTDVVLNPAKEAVLKEVIKVAKAEGVDLGITVNDINRYLDQDNIPSLRTDLERGMPTEIDFINGAVAAIGAKHGIKTPANDLIVSMVKYIETKGLFLIQPMRS